MDRKPLVMPCRVPSPQANVVCVVYDVSEEATIEKVSVRVSVGPACLPLAPGLAIVLFSARTPGGCPADAGVGVTHTRGQPHL